MNAALSRPVGVWVISGWLFFAGGSTLFSVFKLGLEGERYLFLVLGMAYIICAITLVSLKAIAVWVLLMTAIGKISTGILKMVQDGAYQTYGISVLSGIGIACLIWLAILVYAMRLKNNGVLT